MTIDLLLLLMALWLLAGVVDAWVLYRRRHVTWRWLMLCVLTGPLSVAVVFDQIYLLEPETVPSNDGASVDANAAAGDVDGVCTVPDRPVDWPDDDPEGRLLPYGFRRMSDE
jgi:hypothetical protein